MALYEINDTPSIKEIEEFRTELRCQIKLMEYRISTLRPTDLDESILDFYREMLDDLDSLIPTE